MKKIVLLPLLGLLVLSLAMMACKVPLAETPSPHDPVYLQDSPPCGLAAPDDDSSWRQVWRTDHQGSVVTAMHRDDDWLWVATPTNLIRLDLRTLECTRFDLNDVHALLPDPDGRLWVVRSTSLVRFDGQNWQTVLDNLEAASIAFDVSGNLWVFTRWKEYSGLTWVRYPGHEPPESGSWEGEPVQAPPRDACDQWMAQSGWMMQYERFQSPEECRLLASWRRQLALEPPPADVSPWTGKQLLAAESDERLWMLAQKHPGEAGQYDTLLRFDDQGWRTFPWNYGTASLVADEARGGVWAATNEGLIFSDGPSSQKYPLMLKDTAPTGQPVRDLVVDGGGRLWALTGQDLLRYDETSDTWQTIQTGEEEILISANEQGGLWTASRDRSGLVSYYDGQRWTNHQYPNEWPCNPESILADVGGGLWSSSFNCALRGFNGDVWDEYDSGSRGDELFRGPDGVIYAVERNGFGDIRRYDGEHWEVLPFAGPSRYAQIVDLAAGQKDEVWVAFAEPPGLFVYYEGEWTQVLKEADVAITTLMIDSRGDLWAGYSEGLVRYDGKRWEHIESNFHLGVVQAIDRDRQGRIWVGGENGLSVYDPASAR